VRAFTRDHQVIAAWAAERGASPARVRGARVLRLAFGPLPRNWEPIAWDEFFATFDADGLVFMYEEAAGSRICKLVRATLAEEG